MTKESIAKDHENFDRAYIDITKKLESKDTELLELKHEMMEETKQMRESFDHVDSVLKQRDEEIKIQKDLNRVLEAKLFLTNNKYEDDIKLVPNLKYAIE